MINDVELKAALQNLLNERRNPITLKVKNGINQVTMDNLLRSVYGFSSYYYHINEGLGIINIEEIVY